MMFQTRRFTFTLSNPSLTALTYHWQIQDKAGNVDTSGEQAAQVTVKGTFAGMPSSRWGLPCNHACTCFRAGVMTTLVFHDPAGVYSLSQETGTLQGGASQQITLRFSPCEVEDVSRVLVCNMPEMQQALAAAAAAPGVPAPLGRPGSAAAGPPVLKPLTRDIAGKVCGNLHAPQHA